MTPTDKIMALADAYATAVALQGEAHDHAARDALRAALAEPQGEPVAWMYDWLPPGGPTAYDWISSSKAEVFAPENAYFNIRPLYTTPQPAQRMPMTDEEERAFLKGVLYAASKYESVRTDRFTGGDVSDFLQMEACELSHDDIADAIRARSKPQGEQA